MVAATGGVPPYTWSASGLPTGITFAAGSFAGSPTQPGTANISVTVTDSAGTTATRSYTVPIALPSAPALNIGGPGTSNPGTQQQLQIGIGTPYPGPINVTLTLTFTPDSGADDPAVQFQTGGRTTQVTIPAGSTTTPNVPDSDRHRRRHGDDHGAPNRILIRCYADASAHADHPHQPRPHP